MVRQAPVICVMVPPIHLGAWSMALMLWLPFELCVSEWIIGSLVENLPVRDNLCDFFASHV